MKIISRVTIGVIIAGIISFILVMTTPKRYAILRTGSSNE